MTDFNFLWETHNKWIKGVVVDDVLEVDSALVYVSHIPGSYNNYCLPNTGDYHKLDISLLSKTLADRGEELTFYLTAKYQQLGFEKFLMENGFEVYSHEAWMVLDHDRYQTDISSTEIVVVDQSNFQDFYDIGMEAFGDFPGMDEYLQMCRKSLTGLQNFYPDFSSEFFLVYDNGEVAAGGGLFSSKEGNFAYLHCAGTKEKFRGRGYQTALIRHRANKALGQGITQVYSLVENGEQSYSNLSKIGFDCIEVSKILVKND